MTTVINGRSRRSIFALAGRSILLATTASASFAGAAETPVTGGELERLNVALALAARCRSFVSVPLVVRERDQWDHEASELVLAYRNRARQVWECTDIQGPWLNLMREAVNGQVFAFGNPGFLAVAALHGMAHLALFDQFAWDTYNLSSLGGGTGPMNAFLARNASATPADDIQAPAGYYGPESNNIPTLQDRGMVFIACHDSIHAIARNLSKARHGTLAEADKIAADLTNHLAPGVVLVPSVVAFLVELQRVGYTYAKGS